MKVQKYRGVNALALVRIIVGLLILNHGLMLFNTEKMQEFMTFLEKLYVPFPLMMAYVSKGTEFLGGVLLICGLFTRWVSAPLVINMLVALRAHTWQITGEGEHAFLFLLLFMVFLLVGGGKFSLDHLLFAKEQRIYRY